MTTVVAAGDKAPTSVAPSDRRRKFVLVGAGGRAPMFLDPIARDYSDACVLAAMCDPSFVRMKAHQQRLTRTYGYPAIATYASSDFGRMLAEQRPDVVIVCTPDATHHEYIVKALRAGCHVVTEKPMTVDEKTCADILRAAASSNGTLRVAFNYRWGNGATKLYEVLRSGIIGEVISVHFEYMLNTSHGADYFRRWHSDKAMSGGLLVHKSTHHFDLVNWWLDAIPEEVFAYGRLAFYGKANAVARGDTAYVGYPRYTGYPSASDPFAFKVDEGDLKTIYLDAEAETKYIRDKNVFRDGITIEDTMSVLVKYRTGATMTYSLNAFCPNEGFRVSFTGDRGRIEYEEVHGSHIITGASDRELAQQQQTGGYEARLRVMPHFRPAYFEPIAPPDGGHGGGDLLLQQQIFSATPPVDPFGRHAGPEQGAASILVGIAANQAIATHRPIQLTELFPLAPGSKKLSALS